MPKTYTETDLRRMFKLAGIRLQVIQAQRLVKDLQDDASGILCEHETWAVDQALAGWIRLLDEEENRIIGGES